MRARLDEWLSEFASSACSDDNAASSLRERGLDEAQARELAPTLAALARARAARRPPDRDPHLPRLVRAAAARGAARAAGRARLARRDGADRGHRRSRRRGVPAFPCRGAGRCGAARRLHRARAATWPHAAAQVARHARWTSASRSSLPTRPARSSRACRRPTCIGKRTPACRTRRSACDRPRRGRSSTVWSAALMTHSAATCRTQGALLAQAAKLEDDAKRFEAARAALYTQKGQPRKLDAAGLTRAAGRCSTTSSAPCAQQAAHEEHLRMVRLARVLLREFATLQARARSGRHGRPRALRACAAARLDACRAGCRSGSTHAFATC